MHVANRVLSQEARMGALPTLYAATAPGVRGGDYFGPGAHVRDRGPPKKVGSSRASRDTDTARRRGKCRKS